MPSKNKYYTEWYRNTERCPETNGVYQFKLGVDDKDYIYSRWSKLPAADFGIWCTGHYIYSKAAAQTSPDTQLNGSQYPHHWYWRGLTKLGYTVASLGGEV